MRDCFTNDKPLLPHTMSLGKMTPTQLRLIDSAASPYAQKVRIALREKGIPFETFMPEGLGSGLPSNDLDKFSLRKEVPTLIIDSTTSISDSAIILEYIEDTYPDQGLSLRAISPIHRATARELEMIMATSYEPITWGFAEVNQGHRAHFDLRIKKQLEEKAATDLKYMQNWLEVKLDGKEYFHADGTSFGIADIIVAPFVKRGQFHGLGPDSNTPLGQWLDRIAQRPSVQETFAEFESGVKVLMSRLANFASEENRKKDTNERARRLYRDHRLEWIIKSGGLHLVKKAVDEDTIRFAPLPVIEPASKYS